MSQQIRQTGRSGRSWLALAALALGLASTVAAWDVIRRHDRVQIRWATKLAADAIRIDLTTDMEWQMFGLDRLGLLWEAADTPQSLWTKNAELYIQHRPGCIAVEWLAPDGAKRVVVKATGHQSHAGILAFDGVPKALIEAASASKAARISIPISVTDGSKQYAIAYPVYARGQLRGFVVSFFDFERSLGYILDDVKSLGFSLELSQGDQQEYLLGGSSREHEQEWATTGEVPLPGGSWHIRVWPKPGVLDRINSRMPEATLAIGSLLSLLLAVVVHLGVSARRQSENIRDVNEQLELEVKTRADAQEELARAHSQLEVRVHERTAELAAANMLLEREMKEHRTAEDSLRELTGRLFRLQDEERRRLARELHDGATQELVALAMNLKIVQEDTKEERTCQAVNECAKLIEQCTMELRTISYLLHPPFFDELGLGPALRNYVGGFSARSGIQVSLEIEPQLGRLGHETELTIFRVVQEALANVHHHSQSRMATVLLFRDSGNIRLEIVDAGRGIPPELLSRVQAGIAGMGTAAMRERMRLLGGRLEITSDKTGTCIRALLPLAEVGLVCAKTHAA